MDQDSIVVEGEMEAGIGVGVDLGTTHSAVAVLMDGIPAIVPVPNNGRTMPSVIHLCTDNDGKDDTTAAVVGKEAIELEVDHPLGTYRNVKRVIGMGSKNIINVAPVVPNLSFRQQDVMDSTASSSSSKKKKGKQSKKSKKNKKKKESLEKILENARLFPAELCSPPDANGKRELLMPEQLSSHVLRKLYDTVEQETGRLVTRAVIGVPAYFNDAQQEATIRASELAGVPKVKLLREPEAAALAYGVGKEQIGDGDQDELVLVFDLGGGTFDVSMLLVGGGLTEVLATSGDAKLGGADFDLRIAEHFAKEVLAHGAKRNYLKEGAEAADAMVRAGEAVRIFLSNNRECVVLLPLKGEDWAALENARDVIVGNQWEEGMAGSNSTHILSKLDRRQMERLCKEEFQSLLRPIREVAIVSEALLPGDSRPSVVEAALAMEEEIEESLMADAATGKRELVFENFYGDDDNNSNSNSNDSDYNTQETKELAAQATVATAEEVTDIDSDTLLRLQEIDLKERKKAQQRGRRKARDVAKQERNFRAEKRKVDAVAGAGKKVLDGINGRPISRVVLVGGATRMPGVGRLLAAITGVVPQKTVNPDEAVALGCAVQVGVLDGEDDLGLTVLNPMQAAIMRAVAEQQGLLDDDAGMDQDFDDFDRDLVDFDMAQQFGVDARVLGMEINEEVDGEEIGGGGLEEFDGSDDGPVIQTFQSIKEMERAMGKGFDMSMEMDMDD